MQVQFIVNVKCLLMTEDDSEKNKLNELKIKAIIKKAEVLAVGEACEAIFYHIPDLIRENL